MDALERILQVGEMEGKSDNPYGVIIEECGGMDKIFELQQHENNDIYLKSMNLLSQYFEGGEEELDIDASAVSFNFNNGVNEMGDGGYRF